MHKRPGTFSRKTVRTENNFEEKARESLLLIERENSDLAVAQISEEEPGDGEPMHRRVGLNEASKQEESCG